LPKKQSTTQSKNKSIFSFQSLSIMSDEASVTYSSTRGGQKNLDFRSVVMTGLAHDKGLFVPDSYPSVSAEELAAWRSLSYKDLSVQVIRKFVKDDQVPLAKLADIVGRSCDAFRTPEVTPIVEVGGHAILVRCPALPGLWWNE
jgi:threonine synthase